MCRLVLCATLAVLWTVSASAQQVRFFPDFNPSTAPVSALRMNGGFITTYGNQYVLRLTGGGTTPEASATWFAIPQVVNAGFTTYFRFQIHNAPVCCTPGDGLAFVVQAATSTDSSYGATGAATTARGVGNGGIGYAGIPNSVAIEFDTATNSWDPSANHVAVQGCGTNTNGPVHEPGTYTIGSNHNVTSCLIVPPPSPGCPSAGTNTYGINCNVPTLGVTCNGNTCADGSPHDVVVEYAPVSNVWTLKVYIDPTFVTGTHSPVPGSVPAINIPYNIDGAKNPTTGLNLFRDSTEKKTSALVGFSASQTQQPQVHDILAWEFTAHAPTTVQQPIPPGGTTAQYTFGSNNTDVTYFNSFVNQNGCDGMQPAGVTCLMSVTATPISRSQYWLTRLKGTPFSYEQCIVYQATGGNCVVYTITCQNSNAPTVNVGCPSSLPNTCNNIGDPGCIQFSTSYYTTDGVTGSNADYLKAPVGTNNWITIFQSFSPTQFDPKTSGTGGTTSDFTATFAVGAKP